MIKRDNSSRVPVAIVTVGTSLLFSNYGSFLQHYSLRHVLEALGFNPVRLRGAGEKGGSLEWVYEIFRNRVYIPFRIFCARGFTACAQYVSKLPEWRVMRKFRKEYRKHIGPVLENDSANSRVIALVGSDQVWWDPDCRSTLEVFDASCSKISYAASADWLRASGDKRWKEKMHRVLPSFDSVSVRELAGVKLLQELVPECPVSHVVDPVFLVGRTVLDGMMSKEQYFVRPTLLVYYVNIYASGDLPFELFRMLASGMGTDLKIVSIQNVRKIASRKCVIRPRPSQFLRAINDATYVITNSFHGTALSLLYHKNFVSMSQRVTTINNQNCRQKELLSMVGLQNRLLPMESGPEQVKNVLQSSYPADEMDALLDKQRIRSLKWLEEALDAAKKKLEEV